MVSSAARPPARTCVACRTERPKRELVRIVRTPAGILLLDPTGKVAGRGAYLCADGTCRAAALKKGAIERALKSPLPPALLEQLRAADPTIIEGGIRGS